MSGQIWSVPERGGYMYSGELSDILRNALQPMTRFVKNCDADDWTDKGLHVGDMFQWNNYSNVGRQGGRLNEREVLPETSITITQNSGRVHEYGQAVEYTGVLDDFSYHPVKRIIEKALKNDCVKAFEIEAHGQFAATPLTVVPANGSSATAIVLETTGTPTIQNNSPIRNSHVKLISDTMQDRNIPVYDDGFYRCLGRPPTFRTLKNDLEQIHQYQDQGFQPIITGEIGRSYDGVRFFQQTVIPDQGWATGLSDQAFFFGDDTVMEAIVCPPEIRGKLPDDYGRSNGVAWYAIEGFSLVHTDAEQARIIEWASAS